MVACDSRCGHVQPSWKRCSKYSAFCGSHTYSALALAGKDVARACGGCTCPKAPRRISLNSEQVPKIRPHIHPKTVVFMCVRAFVGVCVCVRAPARPNSFTRSGLKCIQANVTHLHLANSNGIVAIGVGGRVPAALAQVVGGQSLGFQASLTPRPLSLSLVTQLLVKNGEIPKNCGFPRRIAKTRQLTKQQSSVNQDPTLTSGLWQAMSKVTLTLLDM